MTATSQALSAALLHFFWQGTAVALLLWIVLLLLRNGTAKARYVATCVALALMAALPAATTRILYQVPVTLSGSTASAIPHAMKTIAASLPIWLIPLIELAKQWALPVWAAGVSLFALRLALSYRHVAILRRTGMAAEGTLCDTVSALARRMSVTKPVRVLVSKVADSPSVVGWLRPVILLPAAALAGLDVKQLEAILAHELAHIWRHDYLVNVLQTVVETLLFYHPAVWWISARMRHERELCCDDLAVRHCGDPIGYARALTKLERIRVTLELAVAASGGSLLYRIQRLTGSVRECGPSRIPAVVALLAVAVCVPLTVHRVNGQPQQSDVLYRSRVEYPEAAIQKSITGTVLVEATLDGEGRVTDARVLTGPVELRKAGLRSVLDWRFAHASDGEIRQVSVDFTPERLQQATEMYRHTQAALTENFLKTNLENVKKKLAEPEQQPEDMDRLRDQLAGLQRKVDQARLLYVDKQITSELAGRKLIRIYGEGLPPGFQLPVQVGDLLTPESMNAVTSAVTLRDLNVHFLAAGEGEVAIRFTRP